MIHTVRSRKVGKLESGRATRAFVCPNFPRGAAGCFFCWNPSSFLSVSVSVSAPELVGTGWAGTSLSRLYRLDIFKFAQNERFISVLGITIRSIENSYDSLCGCRKPRASAGKGSS
jgi:hypothetical protein